MKNLITGMMALACASALTLAGCRGDANFAEAGNAARDQAPTTEGPAVVGKKFEPQQSATGGSGTEGDCDPATTTCAEPSADGAAQQPQQ